MKKSTKLAYGLVLALGAVLCIALPVLIIMDSAGDEESETTAYAASTAETTASSESTGTEDSLIQNASELYGSENEVQLADYSDITVEASEIEVTEEEISECVDAALLSYADTVTYDEAGAEVEDGDTVNIDFVGSIEEGVFEGGSNTDYDLEIGSGTFIDGFEEALIGAAVGETVTIYVTFPEDTSSVTTVDGSDEEIDLAGREATFEVTINYFTRPDLPAYDDDFVAAYYSDDGLYTTEDFEEYLYEELRSDKIIDAAWDDYVDACTMLSYDETEVEDLLDQLLSYYMVYYEEEGLDFEDMIEYYYDMTISEYTESYLQPAVEETIKEETVIYALADEVGIEITDELYDAMTADYMETYGYDTLEDLLNYYSESDIEFSILYQQVTIWFTEHVQVTDNA